MQVLKSTGLASKAELDASSAKQVLRSTSLASNAELDASSALLAVACNDLEQTIKQTRPSSSVLVDLYAMKTASACLYLNVS